jgi:hypothetical protein
MFPSPSLGPPLLSASWSPLLPWGIPEVWADGAGWADWAWLGLLLAGADAPER